MNISISDILTSLIIASGLAIFVYWLLTTRLGRDSLVNISPRRTNMAVQTPFVLIFLWYGFRLCTDAAMMHIAEKSNAGQIAFYSAAGQMIVSVIFAFLTLVFAAGAFAGRLKGFGLNPKRAVRDILPAVAGLLAVWPIVFGAFMLVKIAGTTIYGSDFEIESHENLKMLGEYTSLHIRLTIVLSSVLVAPVFEEILFRGTLQSMIRSLNIGPWTSITITSVLFAILHPVQHWAAIIPLSMALGYAYEKSGSLWRSIFMHIMFNGTSVAFTLLAM